MGNSRYAQQECRLSFQILQNTSPYSQLGHVKYQHNYIRSISASFPDCKDPTLQFQFIFIAGKIQACKQSNTVKMSKSNPYDAIPSQEFPIKVHVNDFSTGRRREETLRLYGPREKYNSNAPFEELQS
jgi:hypothetical protein